MITYLDTKRQSQQVYKQFGEKKWKPFARENAKLARRDVWELENIGVGKFLLCVALGESLESQIPIIKKYRNKVDIITCDKGFKPLMEAGIKPDYVMICDCNILPKWMKGCWNETKGVKLIATPYANTAWTTRWKGPRYFYVNKDAIESENIFDPIFGGNMRIIPASTNVSNAMVTFMVGMDEEHRTNFAGYEQYLLTGYDYSWRPTNANGKYYSFYNPKPKRYYMHHRTMLDINNDIVFTSENLFFSAKWLHGYVTQLRAPVINCSGRGILQIPKMSDIEKYLSRIQDKEKTVLKSFEKLRVTAQIFEDAKHEFEQSRRTLWQ